MPATEDLRGVVGLPNFKIIRSGSICEVYTFKGKYFRVGDGSSPAYSAYRARLALRRKVSANFGQWVDPMLSRFYAPLFVTFTYRYDVSLISANEDWHLFIKRFNYEFFGTKEALVKYSMVVEFTKRGRVHFHVLFYNLSFIDNLFSRLENCWGHGFIYVQSQVSSVRNVGAYFVKYMSKEFTGGQLPKGFHLYNNAHHLIASDVYSSYGTGQPEEDLALEFFNNLDKRTPIYSKSSPLQIYTQYYIPVGYKFSK